MISIYKTNDNLRLEEIKEIEEDSWVNLVNPTEDEIQKVIEKTGIDKDLITKILDAEEIPRVENSGNSTMIVMDFPYVEDVKHKNNYNTMPIGIFVTNNNYFLTVSLKECPILNSFINNCVKDFSSSLKTRFTIQISLRISMAFLKFLNSINKEIERKGHILEKATGNKELISLLNTEKSLVYFLTALKANDVILEKLEKGGIIQLYPEDGDILEDARIENKQGIEMANIYREILSSMSDTYATIISNNLNTVMKFLASITIVFSIPTMIFSFFGMNVNFGAFTDNLLASIFLGAISIVIAVLLAVLLKKKDLL